MSILEILRGTGINPDGVGGDTRRVTENKKVIDTLSIEDDMNKFIREDFGTNHETNRQVHVMFKHIRQRNEEIRTKVELFLDNWAFQHGGITRDNIKEAGRSLVKYAKGIVERANGKREDAAWREMQGPLAEFEDSSIGGLPSDGEFEKAILKQHPELKRSE